jgi:HlyD family secretion protein
MTSKPRLRWIISGVVAAIAVGAVALMFAPRPVPVDAQPVIVGPIAETVYDQGQARVQEAYVVASPVSGRLARQSLKVGDRVQAGAVVARIMPAAAALLDPSVKAQREAAVAMAAADRDRARAEHVRTAQSLARVQRLADQGFSARGTLDDARAAERQAAAAVATADGALAAARAALMGPGSAPGGSISVTAPASGYVTRVLEPSERTVGAGAPLIEISDNRGLEAAIEFLSQDAVRIREGMAAEVYDWGGPGLIEARVRRIEPQGFTKTSALGVEEQRALVLLQFTGPAAQVAKLGPGYRVWGRVFLRREEAALKIPLGALQRHAGGWAVFRIESGSARLRPVGIGAVTDREAEVLSGLTKGDTLVVFPSDTVKDGVRVAVRKP